MVSPSRSNQGFLSWLMLLWFQQHLFCCARAKENVYFDNYGHCQARFEPFDLTSEEYTLISAGGDNGFGYRTTRCKITFKAPPEYGICLTFDTIFIDDCNVELRIFQGSPENNLEWRKLNCFMERPNQMCTEGRYVELELVKKKLGEKQEKSNYHFRISVQKSDSITEKGVLLASLGAHIGIIVAVLLFIIISALTVLYCVRKRMNAIPAKDEYVQSTPEPSAPPMTEFEESFENQGQFVYQHQNQLSHVPGEQPPPYVPPPPYDNDDATVSTELMAGHNTDVKNSL